MAKAKKSTKVKVTQIKSVIGTNESHRACVRGLGLSALIIRLKLKIRHRCAA